MTAANAQRRRIPLVEGRRMRCPRCRSLRDILDYRPFRVIEEFEHECNAVVRCRSCNWIFSPSDDAMALMQRLIAAESRVVELEEAL